MSDSCQGLEKLSEKEFNKLQSSHFVIDTRMPEVFASCYIKNSVNIPSCDAFCGFAGMIAPRNQPIILIVENESIIPEIKEHLFNVGLTDVTSFIVWDRNLKLEMDNLELLPVESLHANPDVFIVDVRTRAEWTLGHIASAHHMELAHFNEWMRKVPKDKKVATICGSGFRSSIAASILQKNNHPDVASVQGGMNAWRRASFPIKNQL